MQMTAEELLTKFRMLSAILNDPRRPIATTGAYRLAKLYRAIEPEGRQIEEEHNRLVRECGEQQAGRESWSVPKERDAEFQERWRPVADRPVTLDLKPVPLRFLGEAGGITAAEFVVLDGLIVEG